MAKNYYIILGVSPHASVQEIKTAYRRKARELHPDFYGKDHQPFVELQEAYAALADQTHRRAYDDEHARTARRHGTHVEVTLPMAVRTGRPAPEPLRPTEGNVDLGHASLTESFRTYGPSFDEIFDRLWRNFSSIGERKSDTIERLNVEFILTPDQARRGGHVRVYVPAHAVCPTCGGHGGVGYYECWRCSGEGSIAGEYPVMIAFPASIPDGHQVAVPLDRFGIRNVYLTVCFRVARRTETEEL